MKTSFVPLACGLLLSARLASAQPAVSFGSDGFLHYTTDSHGNRIMDFSNAGYGGGGVALPNVPTVVTVNPPSGDATSAIQSALDSVAQRTPDAQGIRGAVLLAPGTFNVSGSLTLGTSGVVLRGSGSGSGGTRLNMTGSPHAQITVAGTGTWVTAGNPASFTDSYVPSGATSFNLDSAAGLSVGDTVLISRPVTTAWIHFMGMDTLTRDGAPQTWIKAGTLIHTDRTITAISGNRVTIDVPLTDSFDASLLNPPGGTIDKYTWPGRISQVGVEHLSVVAPAVNVDIAQPQFTGISFAAVIDAWARDLRFQDTQNTVTVSNTSKQVTIDDVHVTHTVDHTGDRMTDFGINGTQIFVNQSSTDGTGEWSFVTQGLATGPIVVLNFNSTQQAGIGPHQRWFTGLLADNCVLPNAPAGVSGGTTGINFMNRGNHGSGQGWAVGWSMAWNPTTPYIVVQNPPGVYNWCYGGVGQKLSDSSGPDGVFVSLGAHVLPKSLYLEQLLERAGASALANIGYGDFSLTATPSAQTVVAGNSTNFTATVSARDGFTGGVTLSVAGLPAGAAGNFSPASVSGGAGSSTLTVTTSASTPAGSYPLTLSGAYGDLVHTANVTLTVTAPVPVAAPTFTPAPGTFTAPVTVTIASATSGASIRYTTDGSAPSETAGTLYTTPVSINQTITLKAIAFKSGAPDSSITTGTYTITVTNPGTFTFEAESLTATPSGATSTLQNDTKTSGGHWVSLDGNSVGDFIDFKTPSVPAGTYKVEMAWKSNNNRGILNLKVDSKQIGSTLDQYAATSTYPTTTFGTVTFTTAGTHTIRLTVTGKNSASSSYVLSADKFVLVGQ